MTTSIDARTRTDLEEAIREIQIISGFDPMTPSLEDGLPRSVVVGVTSPNMGDGKTTVAMALAGLLARDYSTEVSLVDADFHTHSVERAYGIAGHLGLAEVISGESRLSEVSHRIVDTSMQVVPAGRMELDPARLARSERLHSLVDEIRERSRFAVFDLPATLHSMNAPTLARRCDAVIVVVRHGRTSRADLDRVLHLLKDTPVAGVVVNRHHLRTPAVVRRVLGIRD